MRNPKYKPKEMRPLKRQKLLNNFSVYDIETERWLDDTYQMSAKEVQAWHNKPIEPFLVAHYDGEHKTFFETIEEFVDFYLTDRHRCPHVTYAHNGGKFDVLGVFHLVNKNPKYERYEVTPLMQHSRVMALQFKDKHNHRWSMRDSYSLLPRSLDALCKGFKPAQVKTKMPTKPYAQAKNAWKRYCGNDCVSLYQILEIFSNVIRDVGGCIGYTLPSTALRTFRFSFQKTPFKTYHAFNRMFREGAYYGGRCEIFRHLMPPEDGPFYLYDVNSLYPSVMKGNKYPIGYPVKVDYGDANECRGLVGVMECKVYAPEDLYIPLLPYHRFDRKLLFPVGEWTGMYDFSLIEKALDLGYLIDPIRAWEFESDYIFDEYVDVMYKIKVEDKGNAKGEVAKLLMNSLYGKYAEKSERQEYVMEGDFLGLEPLDLTYGYATRKYRQYSAYHLPAISIRVTALAQIRLFEYIQDIVGKGGRVYYCDTDSVVTNMRIPTSDELGKMKLEYDFEYGVALTPKFYYFHAYDEIESMKNRASKGFSRNFKKRMSFDLLYEALESKNFCQLTEKIIKPASFKTGSIRDLKGWSTVVDTKSVKTPYDKRHVMEGYDTRPLILPDDLPEHESRGGLMVRRAHL
jgi:hypothetical protein